ncbi:MAG: hypothetical protein ACKPBV_00795 [Sphaerospermopsis kisseleviana]
MRTAACRLKYPAAAQRSGRRREARVGHRRSRPGQARPRRRATPAPAGARGSAGWH